MAVIALIYPYCVARFLIELDDLRAARPASVAIGEDHHMTVVEELNVVRPAPGKVLSVPGKLAARPVDNGDHRDMAEANQRVAII